MALEDPLKIDFLIFRQYEDHADFVIAGGNLEVDPRTSESSYEDISNGLRDSRREALGSAWLDSNKATYGNKKNTYSSEAGPLIYTVNLEIFFLFINGFTSKLKWKIILLLMFKF